MEKNYPNRFIQQFIKFIVPHNLSVVAIDTYNLRRVINNKKRYDYIILLNILEEEKDIQNLLDKIFIKLNADGRLIVIYRNYLHSFISGLIRSIFEKTGNDRNWLSTYDIKTFLNLTNFQIVSQQPLLLTSIRIPLITDFLNRLLLYFFPFNHLSLLHCLVARKTDMNIADTSVSIIIPARNEAGNIEKIFERLPVFGTKREIIFVEGHSKDKTKEKIKRCISKYSHILPFTFKLLQQIGKGKADAVRLGFSKATGEILIIYDADMSVKPDDLTKFYMALISDKGEFINGSRLVYPMQGKAMQFINILGNKIFSITYSWLLGQMIKDTLCGTKVLWSKDYLTIKRENKIFGKYDPFGDFDLLLGASKLNLKITDLPVRYFERTYGATNIKRFSNAFELTKFSLYAVKILKMRIL